MNERLPEPATRPGSISRRRLLLSTAVAAAGVLTPGAISLALRQRQSAPSPLALGPESLMGASSAPSLTLRARPGTISLGSRTVQTWSYDDVVPGPEIRAVAGHRVAVRLDNQLPAGTTIHWHGVRLPNAMDGAPHVTQNPVPPGGIFDYEFTARDPGTYFFHSHVGTQLDRGLYGSLIVEDPYEQLSYDRDLVVVLDDWLDGVSGTPDDAIAALDGGAVNHALTSPALGGHAGDVAYPHYLINGRTAQAPMTMLAAPGERVRLRIINAAADTAFRVALGGHRLQVVHTDGFPVHPATVDNVIIAMGERYDALVTLGSGAFPLVAVAEGKSARAFAIVRTATGAPPTATATVPQLSGSTLALSQLNATDAAFLPNLPPHVTVNLQLSQRPPGYVWTINGRTHDEGIRFNVSAGDRVRLVLHNLSSMFHPMHLHGHTFQLRPGTGRGPRKDTLLVRPLEQFTVDFVADNPGEWMLHCHNLFHSERGMMAVLGYN